MAHSDIVDDRREHGLTGLALGSDITMVMELEGTILHYARDHIFSMGMSEKELYERWKARSVWYDIIDGAHIHAEIALLMKNIVQTGEV